MKQKEVIDLIKLIDRCYKTDYAGDKEIINDWYKILKNYELKDITQSLDYYMTNYTQYAPKVYDLVKGYKTIDQKKILEGAKTRCFYCNKVIDFEDDSHVDKCRSIDFIATVVRRFKGQEIDKEKYRKMGEEEFKKYYISALKLAIASSNIKREIELCKKTLEFLE